MWVVLWPIPNKREGDALGSLFERKILVKSPEPGNRTQRKVDYTNYYAITMRRNYFRKLSPKIMGKNYLLVYQSRRKCEIYRDTGVSKNRNSIDTLKTSYYFFRKVEIIKKSVWRLFLKGLYVSQCLST